MGERAVYGEKVENRMIFLEVLLSSLIHTHT